MSPKIPSLAAGLTALGLGLALPSTPCVAQDPAPEAPAPVVVPAPSAPSTVTATAAPEAPPATLPAPGPEPAPTVLLLSNGKVLRGPIVEEGDKYVVKHKIGEIRFRRREVEKCFATIEEAYEYKAARTPPRDPDERMKLIRWCLEQKLNAQARAQLKALLQFAPDDRQAAAMLHSLDAMASREAGRDAQVARTSATVEADANAPRPLSLAGLREGSRLPVGPPVILDLPTALAVRRYQEFARDIQPILQARCARCHNDTGQAGEFQLVQARSPRDNKNDLLLRANLDAALRLVDPQNLNESKLLTGTLRPHGPARQLLFTGANDPAYRVLSAWVTGLKAPAPGGPASPPPVAGPFAAPAPMPPAEGFATGRPATAPAAPPTAPAAAGSAPAPALGSAPGPARTPRPPGQVIPTSGVGYPTEAPQDGSFQTVSPLLNGPNSAAVGRSPAQAKATATTPAAAPADAAGEAGPKPLLGPDGKPVLGPDGKPILVDGVAPKAPTPGRKPKDFKLDPGMMQNMLTKPR